MWLWISLLSFAEATCGPGEVSLLDVSDSGVQQTVVPPGVGEIVVTVRGADGGSGSATPGGTGATVRGTLRVRPGDQLRGIVGGAGQSAAVGGGGGGSALYNITQERFVAVAGGGGGGENVAGGGGYGGVLTVDGGVGGNGSVPGGVDGEGGGGQGVGSGGGGGLFTAGLPLSDGGEPCGVVGGNAPAGSSATGGFGCGAGGSSSSGRAGGGGGFSGGGSGASGPDGGGGGSSFLDGFATLTSFVAGSDFAATVPSDGHIEVCGIPDTHAPAAPLTCQTGWLELANLSDVATEDVMVPNGASVVELIAVGADGGSGVVSPGGTGATTQAEFSVVAGQLLRLIVGQEGESGLAGGGGGGTGVYDLSNNHLLVVAGGGGGGENIPGGSGFGAAATEDGVPGSAGAVPGGTAGSGGGAQASGAGGGGGALGGGDGGVQGGGACGSSGASGPSGNADGGSGCGAGGATSTGRAGGGGGYSGGGSAASGELGGGGGGSFVHSSALSQLITAGEDGGAILPTQGAVLVCVDAGDPNQPIPFLGPFGLGLLALGLGAAGTRLGGEHP